MILTVLGYLILCVLARAGIHVLVFTAARAWHRGKAQTESQALQEIRRAVAYASLVSEETQRRLKENTDRCESILEVIGTVLDVTGGLSRSFTDWAEGEMKRMGFDGEDEPPTPPKLVS